MRTYFILYLLLGFTGISFPQENDDDFSFWLQGGIGFSMTAFSNADLGLSSIWSVNTEVSNNNFSYAYLVSRGFSVWGGEHEFLRSYQLKYGRSFYFKMPNVCFFPLLIQKEVMWMLTIKIGVSFNDFHLNPLNENGYYEPSIRSGIGYPVELELRQDAGIFTIGHSVYTNINKIQSFSGYNINVYLILF